MKIKIHFSLYLSPMLQGRLSFKHLLPLGLCLLPFLFFSCKQAKSTDKQVFHYNEQTGIASLDPAFAKNQSIMWAVHQIYNTLVEVDENMVIKPAVAKSWEFSTDNLA